MAHYKCIVEWERPIKEQPGPVQCQRCEHWFCSTGGLAVHKCIVVELSARITNTVSSQPFLCSVCHRTFHRTGDLKCRKCSDERAKVICEQYGAVQCRIVSIG